MNVKKTKSFKKNRPENYHVHDKRLLPHSSSQSIRSKGLLINCVGESNTPAMELVLHLSTCDPSSFFGWVVRVNETYFGNARVERSRRSREWCHVA